MLDGGPRNNTWATVLPVASQCPEQLTSRGTSLPFPEDSFEADIGLRRRGRLLG